MRRRRVGGADVCQARRRGAGRAGRRLNDSHGPQLDLVVDEISVCYWRTRVPRYRLGASGSLAQRPFTLHRQQVPRDAGLRRRSAGVRAAGARVRHLSPLSSVTAGRYPGLVKICAHAGTSPPRIAWHDIVQGPRSTPRRARSSETPTSWPASVRISAAQSRPNRGRQVRARALSGRRVGRARQSGVVPVHQHLR